MFFSFVQLDKASQRAALSRSSVDLFIELHFTEQARFPGLHILIRTAPLERIKAGGGVSQETPVPSGGRANTKDSMGSFAFCFA